MDRSMRNLLLVVSILQAAVSGASNLRSENPDTRIIGGRDAEFYRYDYAQVSLRDRLGHFCGGSLLASDMVLTAAHCIGNNLEEIHVGRYNFADGNELYESFRASFSRRHPQYSKWGVGYDIGVIRLSGNVSMVAPVKINTNGTIPQVGDSLTAVGWGSTNAKRGIFPDVFQEADVPFVPNSKCSLIRDGKGNQLGSDLTDEMLCAGDGIRDSCYGDSGSALIRKGATRAEDVQVGIVSWGFECAGEIPGIYSRLSTMHEWVVEQVCDASTNPPAYMKCTTEAPTEAPTSAPSEAPTQASSSFRPRIAFATIVLQLALFFLSALL